MLAQFETASGLSLIAGTVGKSLIFAAIFFCFLSIVAWMFAKDNETKIGKLSFTLAALSILAATFVLMSLLVSKQYQYLYVWQNTDNKLPLAYRISAAWASQEGSFLLWSLTSAIIAAIAAKYTQQYRKLFTIISAFAIMFLLGILAYESPFKLMSAAVEATKNGLMPIPPDGRGMNPTLQNYWMAIHPWVIFIGFGGLLTQFSWGISALFSKDWKSWAHYIRPFTLFNMTILGIGLIMGGLWAYETLGWGGFWAWDPVENVSLVPFLAITVLAHGIYLQTNRGAWTRTNFVLAMLPFLWFAFGTFLTRSGALVDVSVHSFAQMNKGAHGILLSMVMITAIATLVFSVYAFIKKNPEIAPEKKPTGHRSFGMLFGTLLLYIIGIMAAIGMSYPFFSAVFGNSAEVVSESAYNKITVWPFVPLMLLMAVVPFLGWTKTAGKRTKDLSNAFFLSVLLFGTMTYFLVRSGMTIVDGQKMPFSKSALFFLLVWVCLFSVSANLWRLWERAKAKSGGFGAFLTHSGVSLLLLGLISSHAFEKTKQSVVSLSEPGILDLAPGHRYLASLKELPSRDGMIERDNRMVFALFNQNSNVQTDVRPGLYFDTGMRNWISRPAIERHGLSDLYFVVGSPITELESGIEIQVGQTKVAQDIQIEYLQPTRKGNPGAPGAEFGAKIKVTRDAKVFNIEPKIQIISAGNFQPMPQLIGQDLAISLDKMEPGTNKASFSIIPTEPIFPVQLFYKPLTILVWVGAGMMLIGGLFAVKQHQSQVPNKSGAIHAVDPTS